jgi:hypothetical protein
MSRCSKLCGWKHWVLPDPRSSPTGWPNETSCEGGWVIANPTGGSSVGRRLDGSRIRVESLRLGSGGWAKEDESDGEAGSNDTSASTVCGDWQRKDVTHVTPGIIQRHYSNLRLFQARTRISNFFQVCCAPRFWGWPSPYMNNLACANLSWRINIRSSSQVMLQFLQKSICHTYIAKSWGVINNPYVRVKLFYMATQ